MKNIPLLTTESGIASLTLEEISFNKSAYVRIQSYSDHDKLIKDCVEFCRAVGAEKVYATGIDCDGKFTTVMRMSRPRTGLVESNCTLVPLGSDNLKQFRTIYNDAMCGVQNASAMTTIKANAILADKSGYFVYQNDVLIGIGIAKGEWVHAIVSLKRNAGEAVMLALNSVLDGDTIHVEVIDSNLPAMCLYERMGFTADGIVSKWYKIF